MKAAVRKSRKDGIKTVFSRNGYYGRRVAACRVVWLWSAVLALLCTLISYPGIWYSDSYVRVATGGAVLNAIVKTLTGHRAPLYTGNAFTVTPSLFMGLSIGVTGHVALYTFCQAFAFFAATFLLIREMNPGSRKLQSVLFACCPLIYGMSVYYEAGIGCVTGLSALILLLRRAGDEKTRGDRVIEFLLVMLSSYVMIGYRTNALTVLPVLGFYLLRMKPGRERVFALLLSVVLGVGMTVGIPRIFDIHSESTASAGIVWEMLTVIQRMKPEDREKYQDFLDEIGGEGSTRIALKQSDEGTAGSFMWGEAMGTGKMSAPGATMTAVKKYIQLMTERPREWWSVKWDVIMRSLGIQGQLDYSEYNYNRWDQMQEYGMVDSLQRRAFYDSFMGTCGACSALTLHPWVSFLLTFVFVCAAYILKNPLRSLYGLTVWTAAFYYLAYLLDTPAYDFRYFYPSLYLMLILDAAILMEWLRKAVLKLRSSGRKEGKAFADVGDHPGI